MRVYLPMTLNHLQALAESRVGPTGFVAFAVTPALREWYAESDLEELEHAAFLDAGRRSLRLLAADPGAPRLRVVVAADVPDGAVHQLGGDGEEDRAAVQVDAQLEEGAVASFHLDETVATADVAAAVEALAAADAGDEDALFVVDSADGHDLLWYDVSELADVLRDLDADRDAGH
jgi:hypothetical protein